MALGRRIRAFERDLISRYPVKETLAVNLNMKMPQIFGVAMLLVGAFLLAFAYSASNAPVDQISNALTGRYTDHTMWYLMLGIAAAVLGGALVLFGRRTS